MTTFPKSGYPRLGVLFPGIVVRVPNKEAHAKFQRHELFSVLAGLALAPILAALCFWLAA